MLDLVFAMDCTGSMGSFIKEAQENIRAIADEIVRQEKADLHLALIEYRDHPPEDTSFVTRVLDFTWSLRDMKTRLDACSADGGGDAPESVVDAMHELLKLSWRPEATKVCVFISDAPPHGLGTNGDNFPTGCPSGLDPMVVIRQIAEKCITMYMIGCEPSITPYRDWFMAMAYITGGQYIPLSAAKLLPKVIVTGTQEEISLQELLKETTEEVMKLSTAEEGSVDQAKLEAAVFEKLKSTGVKTKHVKAVGGELPSFTKKAIEISEKQSLEEVRAIYRPSNSSLGDTCATYEGRDASAVKSSPPEPIVTDFLNVESDISYTQAARMTERMLNQTKMKSKCSSRVTKKDY